MVKKSKFQWNIWSKKLLKDLVYLLIAGASALYANNPYYIAVAPLLKSLENYIKHK